MTLTIDYELLRKGGIRSDPFKPLAALRNFSKNVIMIKGPNSSGKSVLLNIIALAFFGSSNHKISSSLRERMSDLMDPRFNEITFKVELTRDDLELSLTSSKPIGTANDIKVYERKGENEILISEEIFTRHFDLIYDIPENPMNRISSIAAETSIYVEETRDNVRKFHEYLNGIIAAIEAYNSKGNIAQVETDLREATASTERYLKNFAQRESELLQLKRFTYVKFFFQHQNSFDELERQIKEKEKELKELSKETSAKVRKRENKIATQLLDDIYRDSTNALQLIKVTMSSFRGEVVEWEIPLRTCYGAQNYFQLTRIIPEFVKFLDKVVSSQTNSVDEDKAEVGLFYRQLIDFLKDKGRREIRLPIADETVGQLIENLEESYKRNFEHFVNLRDNMASLKEKITSIDEKILQLLEVGKRFPEIFEESRQVDSKVLETDSSILKLKEEQKVVKKKRDDFQGKCMSIDIDSVLLQNAEFVSSVINSEKLDTYPEEKLLENIRLTSDEVDSIKASLEKERSLKEYYDGELKEMKNRTRPDFMENEKMIRRIVDVCGAIFDKLSVGVKSLQSLNKVAEREVTFSLEEEKWNRYLSEYLAKRMASIQHIDREYSLKEVDLLNRRIVTTEDQFIRFAELGTGQAQAAYLMALLEKPHSRPIIAMFDEASTMDQRSQNLVLEKMKSLFERKVLLAGILAMPADELMVRGVA